MANGHGGPRQGTPGKTYGNRRDLMNNYRSSADTAKRGLVGNIMGDVGPAFTAPARGFPAGGGDVRKQGAVGTVMGDVGPAFTAGERGFNRPTDRPGQHVMAGAPMGPGGGPADHGLPMAGPMNDFADKLRGLYLADPDPGLAEIISLINDGWM